MYILTHITEGQYNFKSQTGANKEIFNQEYCICEHPDTERYHAPNNKSFRHLGELKKCIKPKYLNLNIFSCYSSGV